MNFSLKKKTDLTRSFIIKPRHSGRLKEVNLGVWTLRHQTGTQYSGGEWTRAKVAIRKVFAPAPQLQSANRNKRATRDVSFLRSDLRRQQ